MATHYDLILKNGTIVDGLGTGAFLGDIGIQDGRIAEIGKIDEALARSVVDMDEIGRASCRERV